MGAIFLYKFNSHALSFQCLVPCLLRDTTLVTSMDHCEQGMPGLNWDKNTAIYTQNWEVYNVSFPIYPSIHLEDIQWPKDRTQRTKPKVAIFYFREIYNLLFKGLLLIQIA